MTAAEQIITASLDIWTSAVKPKSAAGRGTSIKLELYGIKKLRDLILDLAVRGLLVPQDPDDEPASELLKKIAVEKAKLVNEGKIRKQKPLAPIGEDEKAFKLPDSWNWLRLSESYYSISPSGKKLNTSEIQDTGEYPVVDQGLMHISGFTDDKSLVTEIPHPVVVFGDHTRNVKYVDFDFVAGADGTKILCPIAVYPRYFYTYISQLDLEGRGYARHFKVLNDNLIALPPFAEQHRIVTKVDALMAFCDQLEQRQESSITAHQTLVQTLLNTLTTAGERNGFTAAWARIANHFDTLFTTEWTIDQLKQTILQLAVMGKLVPQDPNDEPASELIKKIAVKKAKLAKDGKIKRQKALPPIFESEKPFSLPDGWCYTRLDDLCAWITSGSTPPKSEFQDGGGVPYLKVYNIRAQAIDFYYKPQFINTACHKGKLKRSILYPGDVVMNIVGPPLGKIAIIPGTYPEWNCNQAIAFFRPIDIRLNSYIYLYLTAHLFLDYIELIGTAGQDNISVTKSRTIVLPMPPLEEQRRIVAKVDEILTLCDSLKIRLNTAQFTQRQLADAIAEQSVA